VSPPLPYFLPFPSWYSPFPRSRINSHIEVLHEDAATLTSLPLEMREKPAAEIVQYILDLKKDSSVALHRTKLMVVGYERVGKTSLLECLFPFTTSLPVIHSGQEVRLEIFKKDLIVHPTKPTTPSVSSSPSTTFHLGDGKWSVSASSSSPATIHLASSSPSAGQSPLLQFTFEDETERERRW